MNDQGHPTINSFCKGESHGEGKLVAGNGDVYEGSFKYENII